MPIIKPLGVPGILDSLWWIYWRRVSCSWYRFNKQHDMMCDERYCILPFCVWEQALMLCAFSLQVPQDEWGGYPGIEKDEEIPCRRMRSSSYVKAMGDDDSGESDTSPKTSPQKTVRSDALVLKSAMQRPHIDTQR